MKNICVVEYDMSVIGGVEQVTFNLCLELSKYYHVHLLSLFQLHGDAAYPHIPDVTYSVLFPEGMRLRDARKKAGPLLAAYFRNNQIESAILQGSYVGFISSRRYRGTTVFFCDHGALRNRLKHKDDVLVLRVASFFSDKTVVLTERNRQDYRRLFLMREKKLAQIYNWVDMERSEQYDVSSRRIISAGRFGHEKGFDMLIKAFAPVARKHPDWQLDLYGDGEMMDTIKELIAEYSLEKNVNLMGMQKGLAERYPGYAMYVLPSHREGLPLVLLEAKSARLPIVSFDVVTGPGEIIRDGVDGLLVPPENIPALSDAMCRLIEDPALRQEFSDHSQENLDKFAKEPIISQWRDLLG